MKKQILNHLQISRHCFAKEIKAFRTKTIRISTENKNETSTHRHFFVFIFKPKLLTISRFSRDVTAAMLVHRTIAKKVFREFDSIIMQNLSDILPLFCTPTWSSHHVDFENFQKWNFCKTMFSFAFFKEPFPHICRQN